MKFITIILFLFSYTILPSQTEIQFRIEDNCEHTTPPTYEIQIISINNETEYYISDLESSTKIIPGPYSIDIYILTSDILYTYSITKHITRESTNIITINIPTILPAYENALHNQKNLGYFRCGRLCHGIEKELHPNGELRISGKFDNGTKKRNVKRYNSDGILIEVLKYYKDGTLKDVKYPNFTRYINSF